MTHSINKVDDLEDPLSHFVDITVHLYVLWGHKSMVSHGHVYAERLITQ